MNLSITLSTIACPKSLTDCTGSEKTDINDSPKPAATSTNLPHNIDSVSVAIASFFEPSSVVVKYETNVPNATINAPIPVDMIAPFSVFIPATTPFSGPIMPANLPFNIPSAVPSSPASLVAFLVLPNASFNSSTEFTVWEIPSTSNVIFTVFSAI